MRPRTPLLTPSQRALLQALADGVHVWATPKGTTRYDTGARVTIAADALRIMGYAEAFRSPSAPKGWRDRRLLLTARGRAALSRG